MEKKYSDVVFFFSTKGRDANQLPSHNLFIFFIAPHFLRPPDLAILVSLRLVFSFC